MIIQTFSTNSTLIFCFNLTAKEYFSNLDIHEIHFNELSTDFTRDDDEMNVDNDDDDNDITSGAGLISMAFSKQKADERKKWLSNIPKGTYLNYSEAQKKGVNYSDFINNELRLYSQYDVARSLPHVLDGLKISQRKQVLVLVLSRYQFPCMIPLVNGK